MSFLTLAVQLDSHNRINVEERKHHTMEVGTLIIALLNMKNIFLFDLSPLCGDGL